MYTPQTLILAATLLITADCATPNVSLVVPPAVKISDTATLDCKLEPFKGTLHEVKWFKDGTIIFQYKPAEVPPGQSFNVPGINLDLDKSNSSRIVLSNVCPNASGLYGCEISTKEPFFRSTLHTAFMFVVDVPEEPPTVKYRQVNANIRAECASPPSNPPINITWVVNEGKTYRGSDTHISTHINATRNHPQVTLSILELFYRDAYKYGMAHVRCVAKLFDLYHKEAEFVAFDVETFTLPGQKKLVVYPASKEPVPLEKHFVIYFLLVVVVVGALYGYVWYKS